MTEILETRPFGSATATTVDAATLVARRVPGYTLESPFYTSREFFDIDVALIFGKHWIFVAVEVEIPEEGDYVTVEVGAESIIVVRDDDCEVRAFHNVCRHRGARLLDGRCGAVGNIVCPYHQWTYRADGELIFAESQGPTFDKGRFGLRPVHLRIIGGLIFICLATDPPSDFDEFAATVEPYISPYDLAHAKVAHQIDIVEDGNWKLTMENNRECHHCEANHPSLMGAYFPFHRFDEADVPARQRLLYQQFQVAEADLTAQRKRIDFPFEHFRELDNRPTGFAINHLPLMGQGASYGVDGAQLSRKLMGDMPDAHFGDFHLHTQPNAWFHLLGDHAVTFSVLPISSDKTLVRTTWLVHADAVEGVDYTVDALTRVWQATNNEDRGLVERAHRGVADLGYVPGPYSVVEDDVDAFVSWYINRLGAEFEKRTQV